MKLKIITKKVHLVFTILIVSVITGCTSHIKNYHNSNDVVINSEEDKRIFNNSKKLDKAITKSDQLYEDQELNRYLQSIMDKLYPEFKGHFHIHVLKQPILNAFILPNGSIYINSGLITALKNEAQIAAVLAHEGGHFIARHSARQRVIHRVSSSFAIASALAGIPPIFSNFAALSSIYGYSREYEREADQIAFKRLLTAGYDTAAAAQAFNTMLIESQASDNNDQPYFFSSHPRLQERIKTFNELDKQHASKSHSTMVNENQYLTKTEIIRKNVTKYRFSAGFYNEIIAAWENSKKDSHYLDANNAYFTAESYRLRSKENDHAKASKILNALIKKDPMFWPAYKSIGLIQVTNQKYQKAKPLLIKYLENNPNDSDADFLKHYISMSEK